MRSRGHVANWAQQMPNLSVQNEEYIRWINLLFKQPKKQEPNGPLFMWKPSMGLVVPPQN